MPTNTVSKPFTIELENHLVAAAVRASPDADALAVVGALKLGRPSGLLMLSGGAGQVSDEMLSKLAPLFNVIGETIASLGIMVVDGGTNAGVMALMGSALARAGRSVAHIGIVPAQADAGEGVHGEQILDPFHTHFILVNSDQWGGETALMYRVANHFSAQGVASIAVLANGGKIALDEVKENVRQGREIIVIEGSERLADEIAGVARDPVQEPQSQISGMIQEGTFTIVNLLDPPEKLAQIVRRRFESGRSVE